MQCMYHLLNVPVNEDEIGADDESYKTWLHLSLLPRAVQLFNYGHDFDGFGGDVVRDHNQAIVKKFKIHYRKLHGDGRAWRAIRDLTGESPFDSADYNIFQKRMREMRKIWEPANAWLDNLYGEQTRDPFKLKTFLDGDKKQRSELKKMDETYRTSKRS